MNSIIEDFINSPLNKQICALAELIGKNDKTDHLHYGCSWQIRGDKIFHVCSEEHREWEVK